VPRLRDDLKVLIQLTEAEAPSLRRVRAIRKAQILYGFGDASGSGFGWCIDFGDGVRYELGEWCDKIQEASSNYRELQNLVNAMLRAAQEWRLDGCELLLYTDNKTAEGSFFWRTAKTRALFELFVTLYKLQMQFDFILHLVWISGTRMIQQGTDGLSGGEKNILATCGMSLGGMVHLHLSATAQSAMLEDWIRGWADTGRQLEVLELGVVHLGSPTGILWMVSGAGRSGCGHHFCDALHKRPSCFHVFSTPLLMTNRWSKQLLKATDVYFYLKAENMIWNNSQHEPHGIFISLPLSRNEPWRLRRTKTVVDMESSLQELPPDDFLQKGNILRKFLGLTRQLETILEGLVRDLLHTPGRGSLPGSASKR
jgi:hypothetical protein